MTKAQMCERYAPVSEEYMTDFNGFSLKACNALNKAMELAMSLGHRYIGTEHILFGLMCEENSAAFILLNRKGLSKE